MIFSKQSLRDYLHFVGPRNYAYCDSSFGYKGALATKAMRDYLFVDLSTRYWIAKDPTAGIRVESLFNEK